MPGGWVTGRNALRPNVGGARRPAISQAVFTGSGGINGRSALGHAVEALAVSGAARSNPTTALASVGVSTWTGSAPRKRPMVDGTYSLRSRWLVDSPGAGTHSTTESWATSSMSSRRLAGREASLRFNASYTSDSVEVFVEGVDLRRAGQLHAGDNAAIAKVEFGGTAEDGEGTQEHPPVPHPKVGQPQQWRQ